jgi:hypothetical protein
MPTALRLTKSALAHVRSLYATNIAMYRRFTVLADPVRNNMPPLRVAALQYRPSHRKASNMLENV